MCGIVGYIGEKEALPVLLGSLQRVSYRGYDSFGVALLDGSRVEVHKRVGAVEEGIRTIPRLPGSAGIGHTRWATVGRVSQENAHPHQDCTGKVVVVHNGDIDNYRALRSRLQAEGHAFRSETDSEVIAHLIEQQGDMAFPEAVRRALAELEGSYALLALRGGGRELVAARKESPLVIGVGEGEAFAASDVPALLPYTNRFLYLEDGELARISQEGVRVWHGGSEVSRPLQVVEWSADQLTRGGFPHFMLKEIFEQPQALRDTLAAALPGEGGPVFDGAAVPRDLKGVLLLGCGSSYHAALVGGAFMERVGGVPVTARVASEFTGGVAPQSRDSLAIALSQSGETADTLAAVRRAREAGFATLAITNVPGSSIARMVDGTLCTRAGPEVAVASTKTFLTQIAALYSIALQSAGVAGEQRAGLIGELRALPDRVQRLLSDGKDIERVGRSLAGYDHLFIIARGLNAPVALEGALKVKEVAYVHAEGCPAGELKHGPFALLGAHTPVLAIVAQDEQRTRMLTAIREVKARGSPVIAIVNGEDPETSSTVDEVLPVPAVDPLFSPVISAVALQLLSYYCARERGCPIDRPRNLAKSVTVP